MYICGAYCPLFDRHEEFTEAAQKCIGQFLAAASVDMRELDCFMLDVESAAYDFWDRIIMSIRHCV